MATTPPQKSRTQILDDIESFMERHKAPLEQWYVGTAVNARDRLFGFHKLKAQDVALFRRAANESDAASLAALLVKRGAKGDATVRMGAHSIYAFKLSIHTNPKL